MAKLLPQNFPPQAPNAVATFDFFDIASGVGFKRFGGATTFADGTESFILTTNDPLSHNIITSGAKLTADGEQARVVQEDFEVTFNNPLTLKGTAYLNITIGAICIDAFAGNKIWISGAQLIKSGASSTSNITAKVSGAVYNFLSTSTESVTQLIPLVVTSRTHIAAGETVRLNLDLWGYNATGDVSHAGWGNDPGARADPDDKTVVSTDTTKMDLYLPFDINVGQ